MVLSEFFKDGYVKVIIEKKVQSTSRMLKKSFSWEVLHQVMQCVSPVDWGSVTLIAVTISSDFKSINAIDFSAVWRREHEGLKAFKYRTAESVTEPRPDFKKEKVSDWTQQPADGMRATCKKRQAGKWSGALWELGRRGMVEDTSLCDVRRQIHHAISLKLLTVSISTSPRLKGNLALKCPCIPSVVLETSLWEQPSRRASTLEARGGGAPVARLELTMVVCVGAEDTGSFGPSEKLLPLLPSWPVGGASATTDNQ